jgi:hypothetical protein
LEQRSSALSVGVPFLATADHPRKPGGFPRGRSPVSQPSQSRPRNDDVEFLHRISPFDPAAMNDKDIPFFPWKFNSKARNCLRIPCGMLLAKISDTSGLIA